MTTTLYVYNSNGDVEYSDDSLRAIAENPREDSYYDCYDLFDYDGRCYGSL